MRKNIILINLTHTTVNYARSFVVIVTCYNKNIFYFICNSHFYSIEHNKLYASNGSLGNIVAAKVHYSLNECESRFRTTLWFQNYDYDRNENITTVTFFGKIRYSFRCISRDYSILSLQQYPLSSSINVNFPLVFFIYFPEKATKRAYVFDQATNTKRVEEQFVLN